MPTADTQPNFQTRCDISALKPGDRLSRVSYLVITALLPNGSFNVRNEEGREWNITPSIIGNECYTANQVTERREVTRTELVEALETAGDSIFTIEFTKQPTRADATEAIQTVVTDAVAAGVVPTTRLLQGVARDILSGDERTLIGYLASTEPKMGRSQVVDLEADGDHRLRLVDHRTINRLVLRGIEYVVR